jgi:hypothetical protein
MKKSLKIKDQRSRIKTNSKLKAQSSKRFWILIFGFWICFDLWILIFGFYGMAYAQKKAAAEEYLTKGEAVMLISATDFMKKKIGELLSWTVGYDISKVNRVRLTPTINYVKAVPRKVPPDGRTIVDVLASVDDPGGLKNISGVRADLSAIGRLPNAALVDNGLFGDQKPNDGIFTLQTSVSPQISLGAKDIPVAVANKKGWLALAKTTLEIRKNPAIIEAKVSPERVPADGRTPVTLTVRVDNPGRLEDVVEVKVDLSALGLSAEMRLRNDGLEGDLMAKDDLWSLQFVIPKTAKAGTYSLPLEVVNLAGGRAKGTISLTVY